MLPNSVNMGMVREYGKWNVGHLVWAGQIGATKLWYKDRDWAAWPTQADAYAGLVRDLQAKARKGMTMAQAFTAYAPPSENNTAAYIAFIESRTGYPASTPLSSVLAGSPVGGSVAPPFPGNVEVPIPTPYPDESLTPYEGSSDSSGSDGGTGGVGGPDMVWVSAAVGVGIAILVLASSGRRES